MNRMLVPLLVLSACGANGERDRPISETEVAFGIIAFFEGTSGLEFLSWCPTPLEGGGLITVGTDSGFGAASVDASWSLRGQPQLYEPQYDFIGALSNCEPVPEEPGRFAYLAYGVGAIATRTIDPLGPANEFKGVEPGEQAVIDAHVSHTGTVAYTEVYTAQHRTFVDQTSFVLHPWTNLDGEQLVSSHQVADGLLGVTRGDDHTSVWRIYDGIQTRIDKSFGNGAGALTCIDEVCTLPLYETDEVVVLTPDGHDVGDEVVPVGAGPVSVRAYQSPSFAGFTLTVTHFDATTPHVISLDADGRVTGTDTLELEGAEGCEENIVDLIFTNVEEHFASGVDLEGLATCDQEEVRRIRTTFRF